MAVPTDTTFRRVYLRLDPVGAGTIDLAFRPSDDGNPNVVHYPELADDVLYQDFFEVFIHNMGDDDIVYSLLEENDPVPVIGGGNTMKTLPAKCTIREETLQRDSDSAIKRLRIVTSAASTIEVVLSV